MTTVSFWEKQFLSQADILVIGNGLVGLQCATHLKYKYPHRKVWVIDRAPFSLGASMRNAGFACFGSVGEILDDISRIGREAALELYQKRYTGFRYLIEDLGATQIGYEQTGGYEIFDKNAESEQQRVIDAVEDINTALSEISGRDSFRVDNADKLGMNILGSAVFARYEGAVQTHLLYKRIVDKAIDAGVEIYSGIDIEKLVPETANQWRVVTKNGYDIRCKKLVLCTNAFTRDLIPDVDVHPARGQVLVTSHIPDLKWRGIMHADKGYIYFRSLGTRILIGGARNADFEGETTTSLENTEFITGKLLDFLREVVIPNVSFTVEYQWSGTMGMATDRSPVVKEWAPGLYLCVRMGGMGLALSALVSRELAALVHD